MSLILNPTRSRTETAYGIKYETTTFSTGVTCTIPTDETSRVTELASLIVEGCARSPMEYEDFRDAGIRCLQQQRSKSSGYSPRKCSLYESPDGFLIKDPVDDGHGKMQFFVMNALNRALEATDSGIHAISAPAFISAPKGKTYVILEKAPGVNLCKIRNSFISSSDGSLNKKTAEVTAANIAIDRIRAGLNLLRPEIFAKILANNQPTDKLKGFSGLTNVFYDVDMNDLTLESLKTAPIWLIDQAHPTPRTRAVHQIARHFPIRSTNKP